MTIEGSLLLNAGGVAVGGSLAMLVYDHIEKRYSHGFHYITLVCAAGVAASSWVPASVKIGIIFIETMYFTPIVVAYSMVGKVMPFSAIETMCGVAGIAVGAAAEHLGISLVYAYALAVLTAGTATYAGYSLNKNLW